MAARSHAQGFGAAGSRANFLTARTCLVTLSGLLLSGLLLSGCQQKTEAVSGSVTLPVQTITVERTDVPLCVEMVGCTLGTQDVPIRARVGGFVESMNFREGGRVKKGDLLYTIDAQPFQAKLVEAQSQLAVAQTGLAKATSDLARIKPLAEMDAVSQQDLDAAVAMESAARASVSAAEAVVDLAEIEMSYTRIIAPIKGIIGLTQARPGEFVGREPNPVVLNILSDINPIRVRFSISERAYLIMAREFLQQSNERRDLSGTEERELTLILADGTEHPQPGHVIASAQAIDSQTGTYTMEAAFPNPDGLLLPGQFARVRAPYQTLRNVTVVPRRAIVEQQGRFKLYEVDANNSVVVRDVTLGPSKDNDVVIESGLQGGEQIIVEGLQKVRPGMTVAPQAFVPLQLTPIAESS